MLDNNVSQVFLPYSFRKREPWQVFNLSPLRQDFTDHSLNIKIKVFLKRVYTCDS